MARDKRQAGRAPARPPTAPSDADGRLPGHGGWMAWTAVACTAVGVVAAVVALVVPGFRVAAVVIDFVLFMAGVVGFLAAIVFSGARALRTGSGVRATALFIGTFAPPRDKILFRVCFAVSCVVGLGVAIVNTDPEPLVVGIPAMAYSILVPIVVPALAGLHGVLYCDWPTKEPDAAGKPG